MRFLLGVGLGVFVGFLIAPASGRQTREELMEKFDDSAREKARDIGARAGEKAYEEIRQKITS